MIKSIILSTIEGIVFYSRNVQLENENLAMPLFVVHKDVYEMENKDFELTLDGSTIGDNRYKLLMKNGRINLIDSLKEHIYISPFKDDKYNLQGIVSFDKDYSIEEKREVIKKIKDRVKDSFFCGKNQVLITPEKNESVDKLIEDINKGAI